MKRIFLWTGLLVVVAGIVVGIIALVSSKGQPHTEVAADIPRPLSAEDWSRGNPDGSIVLVEYGDFQCPGCASYEPALAELMKEIPDLKIVFRHFPLKSIHANAVISSQASEAAGKQGKFWEMHDMLYANQKSWSTLVDPREVFSQFAQTLKLDLSQFKKDLDSSEVKDRVERDFQDAVGANLNSTPTFFLNGKKMPSPKTYDEFKKLLTQTKNS